ncbi:MAG: M20/M25/M40 family metallo-hydrolase [Microcoleus sp.]
MQNIIKAFPQYENVNGLEKTALLIEEYLSKSGIDYHEIIYTNTTFDTHKLYVKVEEFGLAFANDKNIKKKNIVAIIEGKQPGKTLILNGHFDVDCVSTPEQWVEDNGWRSAKIKDGFLYGRGATDMVGGLCSLLLITRIFYQNRNKWNGRIILTAVCDEEIGGNSTLKTLLWLEEKSLIKKNSTFALISEPSSNLVCYESLGFFHLKMTAIRQTLHMGVATPKNNALNDIINVLSNFSDIIKKVCYKIDRGNQYEKVIYNWGIISGGQDAAIPLGSVIIKGVVFLPESINDNNFQQILLEEVDQITENAVKIEFSSFKFNGAISEENPLGEILLNAKFFPEYYKVSQGLFPSPCDARLFKAFSIPVTIYGPGYLAQAHAINEYVDLKNVRQYTEHTLLSLWYLMND